MADHVGVRGGDAPGAERGVMALGAAFLLVAIGLILRDLWTPTAPVGPLIEVRGDVARPGLYAVDPPTLAAAVEAAGGLSDGLPETPLNTGDAVQVDADGVHVVPVSDPLLVALPVDINTNGTDALRVVPGLTDTVAAAIVEERSAHGPFHEVSELRHVKGIGATALEQVRPFVTVSVATPPRGPVDLNTADASALESLPGIGPSLAARIVTDRAAHGAFHKVDDLDRVSGVGPATIARLRDQARVGGVP